jgi:hypothetical protein
MLYARSLQDMARDFRQYAGETKNLPYMRKMLRAARELEARAAQEARNPSGSSETALNAAQF